MALRTTRPVPRKRHAKFGGGASGSQFGGKVSINLKGLDRLEKGIAGPQLEGIIQPVLQRVYDRSQELVHVDTGELKSSGQIVTANQGDKAEGIVEYTANHAAPEEFGAQGREAHPYLRPAWDEVVTFGGAKVEMGESINDLLSNIVRGSAK